MRLTYFYVSNYRSITTAYKINLQNITVFVGKNNEGKSNLIRALKLSMDIIRLSPLPPHQRITHIYSWYEDFPIKLQNSKKLKYKYTELRLDFVLTQSEIAEFYESVGSYINGNLSIFIQIKQDSTVSVTVPKKGKNASALTSKIDAIARFINSKISIQYIPAIRSQSDAYRVIGEIIETEFDAINDPEYRKAAEFISIRQTQCLTELSQKIIVPLSRFMPNIKSISLGLEDRYTAIRKKFLSEKTLMIDIDDGVLTSLANKGDGVKSLTTMAILSQTVADSRIIIIDEPENYLHPEAIHFLKNVLYDLSKKNQVIISTHNPIFVNRSTVSYNAIVSKGEVKSAERIDEIRKTLGVMAADNLMYSDYVIVVEGPSDRAIISDLIQKNIYLKGYLDTNFITVRSIGGVRHLLGEFYNLERYLCKYLIIIDYDQPSIDAADKVIENGADSDSLRFLKLPNFRETELEDLYSLDLYRDHFCTDYQLDVTKGEFKNKSHKWSTRITKLADLVGKRLEIAELNNYKEELSNLAITKENAYKPEAIELLSMIIGKIESDIRKLTTTNAATSNT